MPFRVLRIGIRSPQSPCGLPHVREGRPPRRPHCNRTPPRTSASSAPQPHTVASPLAEACTFPGRDDLRVVRTATARPPLRPHFHVASGFIPRLCPWLRSVLAIRPGVKPVATSARGGTTSASSALQPHSLRVVRTPRRPHTVASDHRGVRTTSASSATAPRPHTRNHSQRSRIQ